MEPPAKRTKLLSDSEESDSEGPSSYVGKQLNQSQQPFKINDEYAQRFEHNKKREERHRLEEKYGDDVEDDNEESSSDETEDDDAELVTADLDNEIASTLKAIRSKDPRVYDKNVRFYEEYDPDLDGQTMPAKQKREKPMTLQDYHRENLVAGYVGDDEIAGKNAPQTYAAEQEDLRRNVTKQMHALADGADTDDDSDDGLVKKTTGSHEDMPIVQKELTNADVAAANQDPETFLSNFMASQAWRTSGAANRHAFDSDNSEDEDRADAFEEGYNMRFEDPALSNEKLKSFARDNGQYSVRRDNTSGRKKAREREKEAKEEAKREREDDKARLRKLKVDEAEQKLRLIKQAAGLSGQETDVAQWKELLGADFDSDEWDKEMENRFGSSYYAQDDHGDVADSAAPKKKPKKPKWDDDIDINDLIPDFVAEEDAPELSADEAGEVDAAKSKSTLKKDQERKKRDMKSQLRKERQTIEELVDASLPVAAAQAGGFKYRDTSPISFGLSAQDILLASDAQLNEYAGLKKLASYRDDMRKSKDRKKLGKKARLREWRKEVFGNADGVVLPSVDSVVPEVQPSAAQPSKKRKRKNKVARTKKT